MGWLSDALAKAKKSFSSKDTESASQPCPLKKTGLLVVLMRMDSREPVAKATVDISGPKKQGLPTAEDGVAHFHQVPAGEYKIDVKLPPKLGAAPKEDFQEPQTETSAVSLGETAIQIIKVKPLAALKVLVSSRVNGKNVFLDKTKIEIKGAGEGNALTGAGEQGHAKFKKLKAGEYEVSLVDLGSHKGKYALPNAAKVTIAPGDLEREVILNLDPFPRLEVKVVDSSDSTKLIPGVKINVLETTTNKSKPEATSTDKNSIAFDPIDAGDYKVTLTLSDADAKRLRFAEGASVQTVTMASGESKVLEFKVTPIVRVYMKCQFKDPEEKKRVLPEKFPVRLVFGVGDPLDAVIGKDGILYDKEGKDAKAYIEVERRSKTVTLEFPTDKSGFIVCEKRPGESDAKDPEKQEYIPEADPYKGNTPLSTQLAKGARVFRGPAGKWTLKNSDWEVLDGNAAPANYKKSVFVDLEKPETKVGEEKKPVELTLNPHWQFIKFEYFDRFYGHTSCNDKPVTPLPLLIEGYSKSQHDKKVPVAADLSSQSNWTIGKNDKELVQCFPWIIRRDDKDVELKHPSKECTLRFITDEDHRFIKSNKMSREYCALNDKHPEKHHLPCADRLRYYDMPAEWRSRHYHCRLSDKPEDQDFFEILAEKETKKDKPLVFSLDDIVLTDEAFKPVTWKYAKPEPADNPNDRVTLFSHKFTGPTWTAGQNAPALLDAAVRAGGLPPKPQARTDRTKPGFSPDGLYLHEGKSNRHDYSAVCVPTNYIADYPDWTRLVIAQGNAHDVFDKRTTFDTNADPKWPVGARAAVRWIESAKAAHATGNTVSPRPTLTKYPSANKEPLFATQPLLEQQYQHWYKRLGTGNNIGIGRFDPILLRCCDVEEPDDKAKQTELASSILFTRVSFNFVAEPDAGKTRDQFADLYSKGVCDRFNGRQAGFSKPTVIVPVEDAKKLKIRTFYFSQNHKSSRSHLEYKILANNDPKARQWCGSSDGTGMLKNDDYQPTGAHVANSFTAAHEHGHFTSQPDDYGERWSWCSASHLDFINYVPGLPYDDDQNAMMRKNQTVRARNLWFAAEWCRKASDTKMKVKFGNDDVYQIPSHPGAPEKNYTSWPVKHAYDQTVGGHSKFDLYLYLLGEDATSKTVYNLGGTVDGVLVITVKLEWNFNISPASWANGAIARVDQHIRSKCNNKFYATGKVTVGGEEKTLNRCLIIVQPRYLLSNFPENPPVAPTPVTPEHTVAAAKYATDLAAYNVKVGQARAMNGGAHSKVVLNFHNPAPAPPAPLPPPPPPSWSGNELTYAIDGNNSNAQARDVFYKHFREMIGHTVGAGDPEVAKLKPIAALILDGSDVKKA